jgi:predicted secreted protein
MSANKGLTGVVKLGAAGAETAILNVTSFSLEETTETIDVTSMDSAGNSREVLPTFISFTGTVEGYWDNTDAALKHTDAVDPVVRAGAEIGFELYPESTDSGALYYKGNAIVTSVSRTQSFDGATQFTVNFDGNGPLDYKAV